MYSTKMPSAKMKRQFYGIHQTTADTSDEALFKAYLDFAYFHSLNAAETYENAISIVHFTEAKILFSQVSCRKREIVYALKNNHSDIAVSTNSARNRSVGIGSRYGMNVELFPFMTIKDAFGFVYNKETRTVELYKKMESAIRLSSAKVLFDFLIEAQRQLILYLNSQLAISNGDLDRVVKTSIDREGAPEFLYR